MAWLWIITGFLTLTVLYLYHVNRGMTGTHPEALKLSPHRWTEEEIRQTYEKRQRNPIDVKPYLPIKTGRRYVVAGGSGLVGGWIVQHLLWRGEDPAAIRIVDLAVPTRPEIRENDVQFVKTDVSNASAVSEAFNAPWPRAVADAPLTVFHTVAYIKPNERKKEFLASYLRVNVEGTRNVLAAAKRAGASVFVATSSGSIAARPPQYFLPPWRRWPVDIFQLSVNAEPKGLDLPLENFGSCYSYSKARAEKLVRDADDAENGFRTGCIRPCHAIYGHGVDNVSSIVYEYLRRGGSPSWLWDTVVQYVNAQNVSIAHLLLEACLLSPDNVAREKAAGQAYAVSDPNPPRMFGDLYRALTTLAHPSTPAAFPRVAPVPLLLLGYLVESYTLLRVRFLKFLPPVVGDLNQLQPAMFNMSTYHLVFDCEAARRDLGYVGPIQTLDGFCEQLFDWNVKQERKVKKLKEEKADQSDEEVREKIQQAALKGGLMPVVPDGLVR